MLHTLFKNAIHFEGRMTVSKVYLSLKKLHPKNTQTQKYLTKKEPKERLFVFHKSRRLYKNNTKKTQTTKKKKQ